MKELPKMYQNKIEKKLDNTQTVYSTLNKEEKKEVRKSNINTLFTTEQKIYNIFNSLDYIYKADVTIVLDNETVRKRIIGKNKDNLITFDNEYIPISSIKDIYK